jgi:hypothetical protein
VCLLNPVFTGLLVPLQLVSPIIPVEETLVAAGFSLRSRKGCGYQFYLPIKLEGH